jgi:predicted acylesterase/phospholipase RssA
MKKILWMNQIVISINSKNGFSQYMSDLTAKNIKAIVLSGSGLLYCLHLGFLIALDETLAEKYHHIEILSGVSGGACVAFLFALCKMLPDTSAFYNACMDLISIDTGQMMGKCDVGLLMTKFGLLSIERFECHFVDVLRIFAKCDGKDDRPTPYMTFNEFFQYTGKTLVIVASDPLTNQAQYFSHSQTPDVKVLNAVRFSMTITGLFAMENNKNSDPLFAAKYHPYEWRYVDGALCDAYPIDYIKSTYELDDTEIIGNFINDREKFDGKTVLSLIASQVSWIFSSRIIPNKQNTILIPLREGEHMFSIFSHTQRKNLIERGRLHTKKYIENYI